MRYTPNFTTTVDRFKDGMRPPLNMLPPDLAALLRERDRVMGQRAEAVARVNELNGEHLDVAARAADDTSASTAARAGKPIPAGTALPKLARDRETAARALTAQEAALASLTAECDTLAADHYWETLEKTQEARIKTRASIEAQANELADTVEAAVATYAAHDWMQTGMYYTRATTWPTEVVDVARHGLTRGTTIPTPIRSILVAAASTVLEEG